jgi:carbon starvation protein
MIADGREKVASGSAEAVKAGEKLILTGYLNAGLTIFVVTCVLALLFWSAARWLTVWFGLGNPPNGATNGAANGSVKPGGA